MKLRNTISAIAIAATSLSIFGCGEKTTSEKGPEYGLVAKFTEAELINHLVDNVVLPKHQTFLSAFEQQTIALNDYCAAVTANSQVADKQQVLQQAFTQSFLSWQHIEMLQLEPLATDFFALRDKINSWPSTAACGVDQEVAFYHAGEVNGQAYQLSQRLNERKGLFAQEYLLFKSTTEHSCRVESGALVGWNDLAEQTQLERQCNYLQAVHTELEANLTTWQNAWQQGDSAYVNQLKNGDAKAAINALGQALFYLDYQLKDVKLGCPLSVGPSSCPTTANEDLIEARYAKLSKAAIGNNLATFYQLFTGATDSLAADNEDALGFDDFLDAVGDKETSDTIIKAITDAQATLASINSDFATAITTQNEDYNRYLTLHTQIKVATDQLKTHFITSLAVDLPETSAGDND
ncbi:imelysin family protein [Catenovulum sp. SX2]|uniref:imelysin family protein n=1 Tax=Catenovulum sp. SX2 TaxID=3398614 RepID=UPI003F86DB98